MSNQGSISNKIELREKVANLLFELPYPLDEIISVCEEEVREARVDEARLLRDKCLDNIMLDLPIEKAFDDRIKEITK